MNPKKTPTEPMLLRRIGRRMGLRFVEDMAEYAGFLRHHPDELDQLFRDLLISVTAFFREPEAFHALAGQVIARLVHEKAGDELIRI